MKMTFLDDTPDLSETVYNELALNLARSFWKAALLAHDPLWLKKPVGILSTKWKGSGPSSTCDLINMAADFQRLQDRCEESSRLVLVEKFKELVRASDRRQFDALDTELQIAAQLSDRVTPIIFEPLVPLADLKASKKPKSPDYSIVLPDGQVAIEVTVINVGPLSQWDKQATQIASQLVSRVTKGGVNRFVRGSYPLYYFRTPPSAGQIADLAQRIIKQESGEHRIVTGDQILSFRWEEYPIYVVSGDDDGPPPTPPAGVTSFATTSGSPSNIGPVCAFEYAIERGDHEEIFVNAIRNSLKQKRKQFEVEAPYLLAVKLGHSRMRHDVFIHTVLNRIWTNPEYEWMSGIVLFIPSRRCFKRDVNRKLKLLPNKNARNPLPDSINRVFTAGGQYHLADRLSRT